MADLVKTHPLGNSAEAQTYTTDGGSIALSADSSRAMVQVFAKKGQIEALAKKLKISTDPGVATSNKDMTALPLSPGQWLISASVEGRKEEFTGSLIKKIGKLGYVSEQGDSRTCFRVSGSNARELMSRGCRLDLHPSVVSKGFCAQTNMAQVGVIVHQIDDEPAYELYAYSGFARSFWQWLTHTAAQFD